MKKKLFGTMVVAVAMLASYSAYDAQNESELTITVLANVEALANPEGEGSSNTWPCWSEQKKVVDIGDAVILVNGLIITVRKVLNLIAIN